VERVEADEAFVGEMGEGLEAILVGGEAEIIAEGDGGATVGGDGVDLDMVF